MNKSLNNKTCIVTGATSGIGYETTLGLADRGASIVLIGRNPSKANKAVNSIKEATGNDAVEAVIADLSSQTEIRKAASLIGDRYDKIDVLINNAGIWLSKPKITEDGIETMFAVNHLAYFYLTHLLMDKLIRSGSGRIINVASDSHFHGKMQFDDLNLTGRYHGLRAYGQSKLANVLFTYELDRRLKKNKIPVTANCVQPGLVKTDIGLKHTISVHSLAWKFRRISGVSATKGAETSVYLAENQDVEGMGGKYWDNCKTKASSKASYNLDDASKLWEISLKLCNVDHYF